VHESAPSLAASMKVKSRRLEILAFLELRPTPSDLLTSALGCSYATLMNDLKCMIADGLVETLPGPLYAITPSGRDEWNESDAGPADPIDRPSLGAFSASIQEGVVGSAFHSERWSGYHQKAWERLAGNCERDLHFYIGDLPYSTFCELLRDRCLVEGEIDHKRAEQLFGTTSRGHGRSTTPLASSAVILAIFIRDSFPSAENRAQLAAEIGSLRPHQLIQLRESFGAIPNIGEAAVRHFFQYFQEMRRWEPSVDRPGDHAPHIVANPPSASRRRWEAAQDHSNVEVSLGVHIVTTASEDSSSFEIFYPLEG